MNSKQFYCQIIILLIFIITLIIYSATPIMPDKDYQFSMIVIAFSSTFFYFSIIKERYGSLYWFSLSSIFILGYFIVFYQISILDFFDYRVPPIFEVFVWADKSVINKSIGISTLGLLSFYSSTIFYLHANSNNSNSNSTYESINSISFITFFIYLFYILFILNSGSYIYGEYTPDDASGLSSYFYKLFKITLSAAIIVRISFITSLNIDRLSIREYLSHFPKSLLIILFWHILFSLFVGDRGPVIFLLILVFGIYFIRWGKIKFYKMIIYLFIFTFIMTMIGEIRQNRNSGESYSDRLISSITGVEDINKSSKKFDVLVPGDKTIELALSIRTLNHSIYNVPEKYDFMYGLYQLKNLYSVIPGLSGKLNQLIFNGEKKYDGSSNFITFLIQGNNPVSGVGSSIVADLYLDFGVYGVVIGLFIFGLFVTNNEYKLFVGYQSTNFLWIATLMYFANSLYMNRSTILLEFSNIILVYLLIKINEQFVLRYKNK